jgi:CRISPR-associated endoribonuclease Cas6
LDRETALPVDHLHELQGVVYGLLGAADAGYARFLHDRGFTEGDDWRHLKLFVYSGLRVPANRRRIAGDRLFLAPGPVDWYLASPMEEFLTNSATGLLTAGARVDVASAELTIDLIEALPTPDCPENTGVCPRGQA